MRQRGFEEEAVSEAELGEELARVSGLPWAEVLRRIRHMLRELLAAAAPAIGICPGSRALYGVDVMLTEECWPKLLEVTFGPGVERPMASDPAFFDKLFGYCFRGEMEGFAEL